MQWIHNAEDQAVIAQLFTNTYSDENPFYTFRTVYDRVVGARNAEGGGLRGGYTNQMFAKKVRKDVYDMRIGLVIGYKMSTQETAYVLLKFQYNTVTSKMTQIDVSYALGDWVRKATPMLFRRTGYVSEVYADIAENMKRILNTRIADHWKGFTEYYSKKVKNMSGYHLD
jgi:hypothetical protein